MNAIDVALLIILLFFILKGFFRGLFLETLTLVGLVVGFIVSVREAAIAGKIVQQMVSMPDWLALIAGQTLLFILIVVIFRIVAGILRKIFRKSFISWVDKGGGALIGLCKGTLIASVIAFMVALLPIHGQFESLLHKSLLFDPIRKVAPAIFNTFKVTLPDTENFYDEMRQMVQHKSREMQDQFLEERLKVLQEGLKGQLPSQLDDKAVNKALKQLEEMQ